MYSARKNVFLAALLFGAILCCIQSGQAQFDTAWAYGTVRTSQGAIPTDANFSFTAYIVGRTDEVISHPSGDGNKTGYNDSNGEWKVNIRKFPTEWSVGETLHVTLVDAGSGETNSVEGQITMNPTVTTPQVQNMADVSLPVKLSSFTAIYNYENCTLEWTTQAEINNLGFYIYRSATDDGEYTKVNKKMIEGAGNSAMSHTYKYIDDNVDSNLEKYFYYLEDIDITGVKNRSKIIQTTKVAQPIPKKFALLQNYPNPYNPETWIPYMLPEDATVTFKIYDITGSVVRILSLGECKAGMYISKDRAAYWDGKNEAGELVSSGVYFYFIRAGKFLAVKKMLLLK